MKPSPCTGCAGLALLVCGAAVYADAPPHAAGAADGLVLKTASVHPIRYYLALPRGYLRAAARVFMTGFSGGGLVTYRMIFEQPRRLAGAALACANFYDRDYGRLQGRFPAEVLRFPIYLLAGEYDPHRPPLRLCLFVSPAHE